MNMDQKIPSTVDRVQIIAFIIGILGLAAGVLGIFTGNMQRFFQSYLFAYLFWLGLSLGSLAFLMLHFLTGSRWGLTIRRICEASASNLWLMAILFIPLLFDLSGLYVWARPSAVQASSILQFKSFYLNIPFFLVRAVIYFAIWIALAVIINRQSAVWAKNEDVSARERLKGWGAGGLILYVLTATFAAIDWMMSLDPLWNSTIYGLTIIAGQILSSLAFAVLVLNLVPGLGLGREWTLKTTPTPFKDLGALMMTFVMGWAYLAYFQLLIIWAGNIPHEVTWYVNRVHGGWLTVGIVVAIVQFVLPFCLLLTLRIRHNLRLLAWLGALIAVAYLINLYWQVIPNFYPSQFSFHWLDLALPVGLGGLWVGAFMFALKRRPALNETDQASLAQ